VATGSVDKDSGKVYAVLPIAPRPIHLLKRGEGVEQKKGVLVQPGTLGLLAGLDRHFQKVPGDEGSRRAALAHWITDDANVLTWRSIVNRVWQHHFGKGLVDTPNDFGPQRQPAHASRAARLAGRASFRDNGGSFKKLHRLILLSAAYRQSSQYDPAFARIDSDNRYLWRMNRQRLDAEAGPRQRAGRQRQAGSQDVRPRLRPVPFQGRPLADLRPPRRDPKSTTPRPSAGRSTASSSAACRTHSSKTSTAPTRT